MLQATHASCVTHFGPPPHPQCPRRGRLAHCQTAASDSKPPLRVGLSRGRVSWLWFEGGLFYFFLGGCLRGEEAARNGGEGAAKEREEPLGTRGNGSSPADSRSRGRQKPWQAAFGGSGRPRARWKATKPRPQRQALMWQGKLDKPK